MQAAVNWLIRRKLLVLAGGSLCKRLSVFFEVLPYHTVRIFLLSPAPTHYRHVHQIDNFWFPLVQLVLLLSRGEVSSDVILLSNLR